jgi:hypothetical protein
MNGATSLWRPILITVIGLGILSACGGALPSGGEADNAVASKEEMNSPSVGLRTPTPVSDQTAPQGDTDPGRWAKVDGLQGTFTFTLARDLEEALIPDGSQVVRSSRSATGNIILQRIDDETFSGEGTMIWSVDDFIEARAESGEVIRTATASGSGETTLDPDETLLWMDSLTGTYGLAIYPAGLYDTMEVYGTEIISGISVKDEPGPIGILGLMDTAGIAGWFEGHPLPEAGLNLGGILELPDGSTMTWTLEPNS